VLTGKTPGAFGAYGRLYIWCLWARYQVLWGLTAGYTSGAYGQDTGCFWSKTPGAGAYGRYTSGAYSQDTRCFGGLWQAIHRVLTGKIPGASGARHLVLGLTAGIHLVLWGLTAGYTTGAFEARDLVISGTLLARHLVLSDLWQTIHLVRNGLYTWCITWCL